MSTHAALAMLLGRLDASALLPDAYAAYRPLITDALLFFLEHLPVKRLSRILDEQQGMPTTTGLAQRIVALMHHCPTLHKLGQIVARDRRLMPAFRHRLQQLETMEPRTPVAEIGDAIRNELPPSLPEETRIGSTALAEASVAVVVPFSWQDGTDGRAHSGVFKVLKPGIEDRLAEELDVWPQLGGFLDDECRRYHLPALDYRESLERVRDLLVHEVRLDQEQVHLAAAAERYATFDRVRIPALLPLCTPRLTAMERIDGRPVTEAEAVGRRRADLAKLIVEAMIAHPVFSPTPAALLHADPHAGNLLVTPQGDLGILDWSLVCRLTQAERTRMTQIMLGALTLDAARIARAIEALSHSTPDESALRCVIRDALRRLRHGVSPGLAWLIDMLDAAVVTAAVRFDGDLMLFRKSLHTLEGVIGDVDADCPVDRVISTCAARQLAREWPQRFFAPSDARRFGTGVSNAELLSLFCSGPATAARFWCDTLTDVVM